MDYERNRRYFLKTPSFLPIVLLGGGGSLIVVLCIIILINASFRIAEDVRPIWVFFFVLGGFFAGWAVQRFLSAVHIMAHRFDGVEFPTDKQMDAQVGELMGDMPARALKKFALTREDLLPIGELIGGGYLTRNFSELLASRYTFKQLWTEMQNSCINDFNFSVQEQVGKDGIARASVCGFWLLFPAKTSLLVYELQFSLVNREFTEQIREFFYRDLKSVMSTSSNLGIPFINVVMSDDKNAAYPVLGTEEELSSFVSGVQHKIRELRG